MEIWTTKKFSINKFEAFELWSLGRMMCIRWVDKVWNDDVLREASVGRELIKLIKGVRLVTFDTY